MERHRDFRVQRGIGICLPDVVSALKTQVLAEFLSLTLQDTAENITTWVCENQASTRGTQPPLNNSGAGSLVPGLQPPAGRPLLPSCSLPWVHHTCVSTENHIRGQAFRQEAAPQPTWSQLHPGVHSSMLPGWPHFHCYTHLGAASLWTGRWLLT